MNMRRPAAKFEGTVPAEPRGPGLIVLANNDPVLKNTRGEGMVQVFRRSESPYESARLPLRGLEPDARYTLTDLDSGRTQQLAGRQLLQGGLPITISQRPHAAVVLYQKGR